MMTPVCVRDRETNHFRMLGSGGAGRIPYALGQVIIRSGFEGYTLKESIEAPRMHFADGILNVEPGICGATPATFGNYPVKTWGGPSLYFGGVHGVEYRDGALDAHADSRRDGVYLVRS